MAIKPTPVKDRLLAKVQKDTVSGCWNWTGHIINSGYARISVAGMDAAYKDQLAHRVSYQIFGGKLMPGQVVRHKCDNKRCVNPDHLVAGTQKDNVADMIARGRARYHTVGRTHCKFGHPLSEENTLIAPNGRRRCRTCKLKYTRERAAALRQKLKQEKSLLLSLKEVEAEVLPPQPLPVSKPFGRRRIPDAALPAVVSTGSL